MARAIHKLSDIAVKSAKKAGRHSDGGGLYLRISPTGSKTWGFMWNRDKKRREIGLGSYPAVPLAAARKVAARYREIVAGSGDPTVERDREAEPIFAEVVEKYLAAMQGQWSNEKHRYQWGQTLGPSYCNAIADKPVSQVGLAEMLALLQLHASGQKISLHKAIRLIQNELPEFTRWSVTTWRPTDSHEHLPRSPRLLREIFGKFGPVAHLWGAVLHEQQWDNWRREKNLDKRGDILPISLDRLPRFIGYAEGIWKLYSQLPIKGGRFPSEAFIRDPWMCKLPTDLHVEIPLKPMPIPKDRAMLFTRPKLLNI
jgi:hypothetical protein